MAIPDSLTKTVAYGRNAFGWMAKAGRLRAVSQPLDGFLAAAPPPQRAGLRVLLTLGSRPRGRRLLARLSPADQLACGLLAAGRYEDPTAARTLGWDAAAVAARGRELRRVEGRP